ncbi:MAG: type IV pili methyl-accepting chemotaxis transducer N-terminal domain-containing protein [Lentisphaeraceae bacterium]|nr:type IV pili methyl-accepting chemotaxis transducer N-terminal domain-containing protein [Lentisphaeraceae bacterium]
MVKEKLQLLNKAGAQRMLTQKLVKLLMMKKFEIGKETEIDNEIEDVVSEFEMTMEMLRSYSLNNSLIAAQIIIVCEVWERFLDSAKRNELDKTLDLNGAVLIEMDKTVDLYEKMFTTQSSQNAYAD